MSSKKIEDLNVTPNITKEENKEESFKILDLAKTFLDLVPKAQAMKIKVNCTASRFKL